MEGYYQTPNVNIPHNNRPKGEIAPIALAELEGWRAVAREWDVYTDGRCNRCHDCHANIWFSTDPQRGEYMYAPGETLALIVAHLRQCHTEIASGRNQASDGDTLPTSDSPVDYR
jgi:hypothetical protein